MATRSSRAIRTLLTAAAFGTAVVDTSVAQVPDDNTPGYLVLKVNLAAANNLTGGNPSTPQGLGPPGVFNPPGLSTGVGTSSQIVDPSKFAIAVVPYQKIFKRSPVPGKPSGRDNPKWSAVLTSSDKNAANTAPFIYIDGSLIQGYKISASWPEQHLASSYKKWQEKGRQVEVIYDLVAEAMYHALPERAAFFFGELKKQVDNRKEQNVAAKYVAAARAFTGLNSILDQPLPPNPSEQGWKERFRTTGLHETPHYAILHFGDQYSNPDSIVDKADLLEKNYKLFFLWNALNGRKPNRPNYRMIVLLAARSSDLPRMREALNGNPIVSDAFYSPTYDILVLSPERMDDASRAFNRYTQDFWRNGWSREDLLSGKAPKIGQRDRAAEDVFRVTTLALVESKLEEEGDYAAVSREANRQLFSATGLLPDYVALPQWINYGVSDLLAKPKGPILNSAHQERSFSMIAISSGDPRVRHFLNPGQSLTNETSITVGLLAYYGGANYAMIRKWKELKDRNELNPNYSVLLRNVLTDRYFYAAQAGEEIDLIPVQNRDEEIPSTSAVVPGTVPGTLPGGPPPGVIGGPPPGVAGAPQLSGRFSPRFRGSVAGSPDFATGFGSTSGVDAQAIKKALTAKLESKAQVLAWALTYYLNRDSNLSDKLYKFYEELGRMPRDMYIDPELVLMLFCKAFDLTTADQSAIDERRFDDFARDWLIGMNTVKLTGHDIPLSAFGTDPNSTTFGGPSGLGTPGVGPFRGLQPGE